MSQSEQDTSNKGGFYTFLFSFIFSTLFFVYIAYFEGGIDLKEIPKAPEGAANTLAGAGSFNIETVENPWKSTQDLVKHGAQVYQTYCAVCHGPTGKGDGVAGKSLNPRPRNLVAGKWTKGGDSISLYNTTSKGIQGTSMAGFSHIKKNERWAIVHYIRSITKNKPKDNVGQLKSFAQSAE